jgi:hypothetical protein
LHNTHAGPDFQNARVRIGETTWAGNAELHLSSSDWQRHGHTADDGAYDNVILHVVFNDDDARYLEQRPPCTNAGIERPNQRPTLYNSATITLFSVQKPLFPAKQVLRTIDRLTMQNWLTRMLVERLEKNASEAVTQP